MFTGEVCRGMAVPSATDRPGSESQYGRPRVAEEERDSDELLLGMPLEASSEEVVTGAGEGLLVLGISEAGYWDCGGRLGKGGIINCRLVPDSGVGRWPWP